MRLGQLPKEEYTDRTRGWLMLTDQLTHASAGVYPHNNWSQSFRLIFFFRQTQTRDGNKAIFRDLSELAP